MITNLSTSRPHLSSWAFLLSSAMAVTYVYVSQAQFGAQTPAPQPAQQTTAASQAVKDEVVLFDDFSGKELDRSKWNVVVPDWVVNDEQQAYVDSSAVLYLSQGPEAAGAKNGALVIRPVYAPAYVSRAGRKFDFISGRINTKDKVEFMYGTAAARIKLPAGAGFWPAFWALGDGKWPDIGEIDIMENVGEPDWVNAAVHGPGYSGDQGLADNVYFAKNQDATQWHIYSVDWTPNSLHFKVDGKLIYRVTRPMVSFFGPWAFDNPKYLILNFALGGIYPLKINGIKEPYVGIPASTVQLIKDGKAKMLVDWVKVTRNPVN